jgi:hypothetical protein
MRLDPAQLEELAAMIADRLADHAEARNFVGVTDLARILGCSPDLVYEHADELGALRIGRAIRFDVDEAVRRAHRPLELAPPSLPVIRPTRRAHVSVELLPIKKGRHDP